MCTLMSPQSIQNYVLTHGHVFFLHSQIIIVVFPHIRDNGTQELFIIPLTSLINEHILLSRHNNFKWSFYSINIDGNKPTI